MSDFNLPLNSKIRLRDGCETVYKHGTAGMVGWVRKHQLDEDGFPLVYVEWEKGDPGYKGQADGWTYESHFQLMLGPSSEVDESPMFPDMITNITASSMPSESIDYDRINQEDVEARAQRFFDELGNATDMAADSYGFFMITVNRVAHPDNEDQIMFVPEIFFATLEDEIALILEAQIAGCTSASHVSLISQLLNIGVKRGNDEQTE